MKLLIWNWVCGHVCLALYWWYFSLYPSNMHQWLTQMRDILSGDFKLFVPIEENAFFLDQSLIEFQFTQIKINIIKICLLAGHEFIASSIRNSYDKNCGFSTKYFARKQLVKHGSNSSTINYFMFRRVMAFVSIDSICRWINILDYWTAAMNCIQFEQSVVFLCSCL